MGSKVAKNQPHLPGWSVRACVSSNRTSIVVVAVVVVLAGVVVVVVVVEISAAVVVVDDDVTVSASLPRSVKDTVRRHWFDVLKTPNRLLVSRRQGIHVRSHRLTVIGVLEYSRLELIDVFGLSVKVRLRL